jgi:dihydroorotate dehydrogenase (fumarate)
VIIGGPMTGMHVTDIPVIASVNAVTSQSWVEYAGQIQHAGADALELDIDPVALKPMPGYQCSSPAELPLPLRWVAILSPQIRTQYSLSTGVHSALDAVKALTAGAQVVQVASVLYLNRVGVLSTMIDGLGRWLDDHGIPSVEALRGRLAAAGSYQPEELERLQYIRALTGIS